MAGCIVDAIGVDPLPGAYVKQVVALVEPQPFRIAAAASSVAVMRSSVADS